ALKGTEITFTGAIAEIKASKVIFKSSANDSVICELAAPLQKNQERSVGSSLTVVGRVRGRGILGNVTLDQCRFAAPVAVLMEPVTVEPPLELPETPAAVRLQPVEPHPFLEASAPESTTPGPGAVHAKQPGRIGSAHTTQSAVAVASNDPLPAELTE